MIVLSRLRDPSHWINRIVFVLSLVTLELLAIGVIGLVMPLGTWESFPSIGAVVMIIFWSSLFGIVLLDERRQPHGSSIATGIIPTRQTPRMIFRGVLWAFAMLCPIAVTGIILGSKFRITTMDAHPLMMLSIIVASVGEEVLFRSTILRALKDRFGSGWAIVITSILFSVAHTGNPSASMISSINTFLIGVAFATVIAVGGSVWVAAACHAAWNVLVALFFGTVSGNDVGVSWMKFVPNDASVLSPLLMGDAYGVESGLVCSVVITISLGFIRHIVVIDPFVTAARYRVVFNRGRSRTESITAMESSNVA